MSKNYKKLSRLLSIFIILSSFIGISARGQVFIPDPLYGQIHHRGAFDSTLYSPTYHGVPTDSTYLFSHGVTGHGQILKQAAFYYDSVGHTLYVWDPALKSWQTAGTVSGSTFDSTSLSNRINQRLPYVDTAAMLAAYLQTAVAVGLFYPLSTNPASYLTSNELPNVVNALQVINAGGAVSWSSGLYSARPSSGIYGRFYFAADSVKIYFDNGGGWLTIPGGGGGGGSNTFAGDLDVNVLTPVSGQLTKYLSSKWTNFTPSITDITTWAGFTPEDVANKSTVGTLGISDVLYPTQHAVKTYVDNSIAGVVPALTATQIGFGNGSNKLSGSSSLVFVNTSIEISPGINSGSYSSGLLIGGSAFQNSGSGTISSSGAVGTNKFVLSAGSSGSISSSWIVGGSNTVQADGTHSLTGEFISGETNLITNSCVDCAAFGSGNTLNAGSRSALFGQGNYISPLLGAGASSQFGFGYSLTIKSFKPQTWFGINNDTSWSNFTSILFGVGNGISSASNAFWIDSLANGYLHPGNTAGRPASPIAGNFRINSDSAFRIEVYDGSAWHGTGSGSGGGGGSVTAVNGTANRVTSTGGSSPTIDISATFEALLSKKANTIDVNNASSTSAELASLISDETGTGKLAFATSGVFTTPRLNSTSAIGQVWAANDINGNAAFTSLTNAMLAFSYIKFGTSTISLGATTSPFVSGFTQINDTTFIDTKVGGTSDTFRLTNLGINDTTYYLGGVNISGPSNHDTVTLGGTLLRATTVDASSFGFRLNFGSDAGYDMIVRDSTTNYWKRIAKGTIGYSWQVLPGGGIGWAAQAGGGGSGITGLTAGRVSFAAGSTSIMDDGSLFWDNTNKRLGIGTSTPTADLLVKKGVTGDVSAAVWNTTACTSCTTNFQGVNDLSKTINMGLYSSTTTTYGTQASGIGYIETNSPAGLAIVVDANAPFTIATGTGAPALERLKISGTGAIKFDTYGSGTNTGTATYGLSVDASGNVIETTASGIAANSAQVYSSGSTVTISNGNNILNLQPTSTVASLVITMPATPHNGGYVTITDAGGTLTGTVVTSLSIVGSSGQTFNQALTPTSFNHGEPIIYLNVNPGGSAVWQRIQ